jgi:16S rRNA (cytidine1402-2'-O)-methyltransferase
MALVLSGLPTERFVFEGFLPRSGGDRTRRLADLAAERRTIVLYEAPHRVARTVHDLVEACGPDRRVALCRELTKLHEEVWRGTLASAAEHLAKGDPIGEFVVVLGGAPEVPPPSDDEIVTLLREALDSGMSKRDAAAHVAASTGRAKRDVYSLALPL